MRSDAFSASAGVISYGADSGGRLRELLVDSNGRIVTTSGALNGNDRYEVELYGYDDTDTVHQVLTDASGRIITTSGALNSNDHYDVELYGHGPDGPTELTTEPYKLKSDTLTSSGGAQDVSFVTEGDGTSVGPAIDVGHHDYLTIQCSADTSEATFSVYTKTTASVPSWGAPRDTVTISAGGNGFLVDNVTLTNASVVKVEEQSSSSGDSRFISLYASL